MNITKKFAMLLTSCILMLGSGAVAFADSAPSNLASDSVITTKIKAKMLADKEISSLNIGVETNNGVVTLSGTVPTDNQASAVIETAAATDGVKNVETTHLVVQKSTQPFTDTVITAKVKGLFMKEKVFGDNPISVTGISVETKNGVVYLTGDATSAQAANAEKLARTVDGVKSVDSRINIEENK